MGNDWSTRAIIIPVDEEMNVMGVPPLLLRIPPHGSRLPLQVLAPPHKPYRCGLYVAAAHAGVELRVTVDQVPIALPSTFQH